MNAKRNTVLLGLFLGACFKGGQPGESTGAESAGTISSASSDTSSGGTVGADSESSSATDSASSTTGSSSASSDASAGTTATSGTSGTTGAPCSANACDQSGNVLLSCDGGTVEAVDCEMWCLDQGFHRVYGCFEHPAPVDAACVCDESATSCSPEDAQECVEGAEARICKDGVWEMVDCDKAAVEKGYQWSASCEYDSQMGVETCFGSNNPCPNGTPVPQTYCDDSGLEWSWSCTGSWTGKACSTSECESKFGAGSVTVGCVWWYEGAAAGWRNACACTT